jgi:hypothetical protein
MVLLLVGLLSGLMQHGPAVQPTEPMALDEPHAEEMAPALHVVCPPTSGEATSAVAPGTLLPPIVSPTASPSSMAAPPPTQGTSGRPVWFMPTPLSILRTDEDILQDVMAQLARVTVLSGTPRIRLVRHAQRGDMRLLGFAGMDDTEKVIVVAECHCDTGPLHLGNVQFLIWVADRRYPGAGPAGGPGTPALRELLNDPTIPIPTRWPGAP